MSGAARHTEASHPRTLGVLHGGDGGDAKCGRQDAGWGLSNELTPGTHASGRHRNAGGSELVGDARGIDMASRGNTFREHPQSVDGEARIHFREQEPVSSGERVKSAMTATNSKVRSVMGSEGPFSEDTDKEAEKRTDAGKGGWTPDAGKEGKEQSHKAPQNAYQGGGKPAGRAGGTQSSN